MLNRTSLFRALLLVGAVGVLAGCGHHHHHEGDIVLSNRTHLQRQGPPDDLTSFQVAAFGEFFGPDLIGGFPLPPAADRRMGTFNEDYYDGLAFSAGMQRFEWQDLFVGDEEPTYFDAE